MSTAVHLMDRPPRGMAELRTELHHELRSQTWRLVTALIASQAMFAAIVGAVVRFT